MKQVEFLQLGRRIQVCFVLGRMHRDFNIECVAETVLILYNGTLIEFHSQLQQVRRDFIGLPDFLFPGTDQVLSNFKRIVIKSVNVFQLEELLVINRFNNLKVKHSLAVVSGSFLIGNNFIQEPAEDFATQKTVLVPRKPSCLEVRYLDLILHYFSPLLQ